MEWHPAGWSVCLPLFICPCTMKSRSSLLAPAHPGGPSCGGVVVLAVICIHAACVYALVYIQLYGLTVNLIWLYHSSVQICMHYHTVYKNLQKCRFPILCCFSDLWSRLIFIPGLWVYANASYGALHTQLKAKGIVRWLILESPHLRPHC